MQPYSTTEEGLASLNSMFEQVANQRRKPYLYKAALLYFAAYYSSQTSFSQLFKMLSQYIDDYEKIWKFCLRVKRGIIDTSENNGMYKDQIYFIGAIEILQNLHSINFLELHSGKMSLEDYFKLSKSNQIVTENIKLPYFLKDMNQYLQVLQQIAKTNFIEVFDKDPQTTDNL